MSFLKKLFGQKKEVDPAEAGPVPSQPVAPSPTLQELFEQFAGSSFEKQFTFAEVIGNNNWSVDMIQGLIKFGDALVFPLQVLGTFSHASQTWLWGWANTESGIPEGLLLQANMLKQLGETHAIPELRDSQFEAQSTDLHTLGCVASGMFNNSAYYLADYRGGVLLAAVPDVGIEVDQSMDHHRVLVVFPQLITHFELNHRRALQHYLEAKGYAVTQTENGITATREDRNITADFDEHGLLMSLNG